MEIDAPSELRKLLTAYLDVARFQTAPSSAALEPSELDRLIALAPAQARALLETEGYFESQVQALRQAQAHDDGLPRVRIIVTPGVRTTVSEVTIDIDGPFAQAAAAGDATAVEQLTALRREWALPKGRPFRQAAWNSAKASALAKLRSRGWAAATWASTQAKVDAAQHTAQLTLRADSGPLYRLGPLQVIGIDRYPESSVRQVSTFKPGTPYDEQLLLDYQDRLQKGGLFLGASVELDAKPETADAAPVTVRVREKTLQESTIGLGYSANVGPRVSVEHFHRSPFGLDAIVHNKVQVGPQLKSWDGELTTYPLGDWWRNFISGSAQRLRSDDQMLTSWSTRLGRVRDLPVREHTYFVELLHARVDTQAGATSSEAVAVHDQWILRKLDSLLLPTDGYSLSLQAALGQARSDTAQSGAFARAYARYTGYYPLPGQWLSTTRLELGHVFARDAVGVPDTLLFRAGGDDSVRGYGFRTLGPIAAGVVTSGRVLMTASAEASHPLIASRPEFQWAAFVDAGNAAHRWSDLHPDVGYGLGLRWRSPIGPVRADVAYGQAVRQLRLHVSVGVTF